MGNISRLRLVGTRPSLETIRELEMLLSEARGTEPDLLGIAYVAVSRSSYTVNAVGLALERPTLARGMIRVLDDLLRERQTPPRRR